VGVEARAAQKIESTSMNGVATALCYRVQHAAHGAAILGRDVRRYNLKLLNGVGRNLRLDTGAPRILIVVLFSIVVAVQQERIIALHAAERQQPERAVISRAGRIQDEGVDAPAVYG
jgi:hypothetical protein